MFKRVDNVFFGSLSLFVAVFVVIPFVSSCGKSGSVSPSALNVQFQVINLSPDLGSVDLYVNFAKVNSTSYFYPTASGYFYLNSIDTPFQLRPGTSLTTGAVVPSSNIFPNNMEYILKPNTKYTLMVIGLSKSIPDSLDKIFTTDTSSSPTIGRGKIRFINASPRSAGFDLTANNTTAFTNVAYKAISAYRELPAGVYDFKIYPTGTSILIQDVPNITIQDGRVYTLYCYGLAGHTDSLAFGTGTITNQ